ncbi:MAG: class GN sortase [Cellvibrionaceae bacterium]
MNHKMITTFTTMKINPKTIVSILLLIAGTILLSKIFYLEGKAIIAQQLLIHSWHKSKEIKRPVKPWMWADIHPVGALRIPRLDIHQIILEGHNGEALAFGPGLIKKESSMTLAGHRDSHFEFLKDLRKGDNIFIEPMNGKEMTYVIHNMFVQDLREVEYFTLKDNQLSLITCYPFDSATAGGPLRYIVEAHPAEKNISHRQTHIDYRF